MVTTKKKIIIGLVAIVVVGFIAFAAFGTAVTEKNARYGYEAEFADTYNSSISGLPQTPDDGKKFLIVKGVMANDKVDDGITTNPWLSEWTVTLPDRTTLTYGNVEPLYPTEETVGIQVGGKAVKTYCWQVDESLTLDDIGIACEWDGAAIVNYEYDPDLKP